MRWLRSIVCVVALAACAPTIPQAWRDAMASGDRALHAGRAQEAAARYDEAAREASRPRDRDEAAYRAAMALARSDRDGALARLDAVAVRSPDFERGARAAYEAAMMRRGASDEAERSRGLSALEALVRERPETGPARLAVDRVLDARDAEDASLASSIAWVDAALADPRVEGAATRETLCAERALRLARAGRRGEAVAAWRALFRAVPYPQNSRWDDGHIALATLLREGGDARAAVEVIDEMLAARDPGCTGGSCDAPEFQEGAMLRAVILRDDLREMERAAEAFHRTYEMFPESRVRDDALREEARVRDRMSDGSACVVWERLANEFPCTRRGREGRERAQRCGRPSVRGCE